MTKYIIMRERRRRKGKKGEARGTFWTVELKVPKMIDRLKKPISLYGMPPYMNEQEAETVARALVGIEFKKIPLARKQMRLGLAAIHKPETPMLLPKSENRLIVEGIDYEKLAPMVARELAKIEPQPAGLRFTMPPDEPARKQEGA